MLARSRKPVLPTARRCAGRFRSVYQALAPCRRFSDSNKRVRISQYACHAYSLVGYFFAASPPTKERYTKVCENVFSANKDQPLKPTSFPKRKRERQIRCEALPCPHTDTAPSESAPKVPLSALCPIRSMMRPHTSHKRLIREISPCKEDTIHEKDHHQ